MSKKAQDLAHSLCSEIKIRKSDLVVVESVDSNGDPTILIGTGVASARNAVIRVKAIDWALAKDVLGLPATMFTPHVIQLCTESNPGAGAGADVLTAQDVQDLMVTIGKRGTRFEWYKTAFATAPTAAAMIVGNLKATIEADLYWGMKASQ
jgi:hypothetical protein